MSGLLPSLHHLIKPLHILNHSLYKRLFPGDSGAVGAVDEVEPGVVDQLHAVAMVDVVVGGQFFGVSDALRDDGCKLNRTKIITAVKAGEVAASGIQESPVQIKWQK